MLSLYAALEGEGEKVSGGSTRQNAEGIRVHTRLIQLHHSEKGKNTNKQLLQHTETADIAVTLRSGQPLLSVCIAVLSLSLLNPPSCNTPSIPGLRDETVSYLVLI